MNDARINLVGRKRLARLLAAAAILFLLVSLGGGVVLAELHVHVWRKPLGPTPPDMQDVSLRTRDNVTLRAWFSQAPQPNGDAVILLHGIADNREGVLGYAEMFRQHGYTVLLPDARGHGRSEGLASYGLREAGDVHEWADWLTARVHPRCLFGLGESMGAAILLQSLVAEPRFCAVVAESPFSNFRRAAYDRPARFLGGHGLWVGRTLLRPVFEVGFEYARLRYGLPLADASPVEAVARSRTPVLLIHGLADLNMRPYHSRRISDARPDHHAIELWEVPGAGHCGAWSTVPKEFETRVLNWFQDNRLL
jgi:dipeptidyl aminopeptidase/acylaminoacyl peptidase